MVKTCASNAEGTGSQIPHATQQGQKNKTKQNTNPVFPYYKSDLKI